MKKGVSVLFACILVVCCVCFFSATVSAESNVVFEYEIEDEQVTITGCNDDFEGELVIPETLEGYPVTQIEKQAFYYHQGITSVKFPDSLKIISGYAFYGCKNLASIEFGSGLELVYNAAFVDCSSLKTVTIPGKIGHVSDSLFHSCTSLETVIIGEGIDNIQQLAFYNCKSLKYVWLPKSLTEIYSRAFYECPNIETVWYGGSETDNSITYGSNNFDLFTAEWRYDSCTAHTYTGACDTRCDDCEFPRTTSTKHTYSNACDKTCNKCGTTRTVSGHKYDTACDKTCNVCGATRSITHSYKTVITKATLTAHGKKQSKCSVCGYVASTSTTIYRPLSFTLSATSYTYNGTVKSPTVTVKDYAGKVIPSSNYTVKKLTGCKNVGTQQLLVTMKGDYSGSKTLTFKINPISISKCSVKLSTTAYTYNGAVKTPSVVVKNANGTTLTKNTHYTVTYASGRKNAGTYSVKVMMKGNYSGSKTLTFKINPISISKCSVKLSATKYTYDGKVKTPSVVVKSAKGTTLTKNTHYTVTYASGRTNVGTYKVTVKMKGNYSGTKTLTYTIAPVAKKTVNVYAGETAKIGAKSNKAITYTSSNTKVATVSSKGVITAKQAGTATVTVKSGGISEKVTVKVTKIGVTVSGDTTNVYRGKTLKLKAKTTPSSAKVTWSVSDTKIAKITSSGTLTGLKDGTVTVTAKITYKGKTYKGTYKVNVVLEEPAIRITVAESLKWHHFAEMVIVNEGSKPVKMLASGRIKNIVNSAKYTSFYHNKKFCSSITIDADKTASYYLYFGSEEVWTDHDTTYWVTFEYDGATYTAFHSSSNNRFQICTNYKRIG